MGESVMDVELELARRLDVLEDAAFNYIKTRKATIKTLMDMANDVEKHHKNAKIAKVAGSTAGIVGSGLAIGGFVASFFTFGASLILVGIGAGIGAAGGATTVGGILTEVITTKLTSTSTKEVIEYDKKAYEDLTNALDELNTTWTNFKKIAKTLTGAGTAAKSIYTVVDSIYDLVRVGSAAFQAGEAGAQTAFRAASVAGRGLAIAGVVFNVVAIPLDLYTLITNSIDIHKSTPPQIATEIRKVAESLDCPSQKEMQNIMQNMRHQIQQDVNQTKI